MSFPPAAPYQGQQQPAVPQFGLPRRLPPAEDAGNWGLYTPGQAEAPENPAAPPPVTGELAGAETIVEADATEGLRQHTTPFCSFVQQVVVEESDPSRSSLLVVDNRDERIYLSFSELASGGEIISSAASSINVLTERDQVMPPNSGYHCSLFANYTSYGRSLCSVGLLCEQGSASQPFTWPVMFDTSATYVDVKVFNGNEVLFHWVFRAYRSDPDLSVQ